MFDIPPARATDVAVGPGTDTPPVAAPPIGEVVPTVVIRRVSPVAELIPGETCLREQLIGQQVLVGEIILLGHGQFASANSGGQPRSILDDQGVRAQVIRSGSYRCLDACPPIVKRFAGSAIDQIEAGARKTSRLRFPDCLLWSP